MAAWLSRVRLLAWRSGGFTRGYCSSDEALHACIVGSGPAGFYVAKKLLKRFDRLNLDILERLPGPFGLVRSGVAPDHPETKNVINQFSRIVEDQRCRFYGNVCVDKDVSLEELRKNYHIVVLAYGAESDNKLEIPGENLQGVFSAREFVWWYNGHPDGKDLPVDLENAESAVVLGQGNVALDVARILLRSVDDLSTTDIAEHALNALRTSRIRKVYVVGRRGPVQAACTAKELREILGLKGVDIIINEADLQTSNADLEELNKNRIHRRVYELFRKAVKRAPCGQGKELHFVFFRAPATILTSEDNRRVRRVRLEKTFLEGSEPGSQRLVKTGELEDLQCELVLKSIGYKGLPITGLPFNQKKGIVPNVLGRVQGEDTTGLYVAGWLKRGPTGIIGTNEICAEEVVKSITDDVECSKIASRANVPGRAGLESILKEKNKRYISVNGWERIDEAEVKRGEAKCKPREKIVSTEEALRVGTAN